MQRSHRLDQSCHRGHQVRRLKALHGRLVVEPDLPPGFTCGGYQSPYLPELADEELRAALALPGLALAELDDVRAELYRRAAMSDYLNPYGPGWISLEPDPTWDDVVQDLKSMHRSRMEARAEREADESIERLRRC